MFNPALQSAPRNHFQKTFPEFRPRDFDEKSPSDLDAVIGCSDYINTSQQ
jgi:hypothetical protein